MTRAATVLVVAGVALAGAVRRCRGWPPLRLRRPEPGHAGDAARRRAESRRCCGCATARRCGSARTGRATCRAPSCHGDAAAAMRGVAARYPAFDAALGQPVDLGQRIEQCRARHQGAPPWRARKRGARSRLEAYVAHQSRGLPIAPLADPRLVPFRDRGRSALAPADRAARPRLRAVPRRQPGPSRRRQRHPAGPSDRLPDLPARVADAGVAAAAAARLHERRARRALFLRRAGAGRTRAVPRAARRGLAIDTPAVRP